VRDIKKARTLAGALVALSLVAAACGSSKKSNSAAGGGTTTTAPVKQGGDLVFGAEQEPDCADWMGSCAGASWGQYTFGAQTMPRTFDINPDSTYKVSDLLTEEPKLEQGPPQKVTYKINPKAVWSDGQPITSTDFKYTWDQVVNGKDIYDTTGFKDIATVDDTDPHTAVVTFKNNFAAWRDLFGGFFGIFPSHLLAGKDRDAEMKDGYKFSGGPWMLDHWTKGQEIKLVPNPAYWGKKPNLSSITWKFITDTAAEQQAYKTGQVSMIYPQAQLELTQLKGLPDTKFDVNTSLSYEAIWMNNEKFPLDSVKVRQALAYATDRNAIVQQLFGPVQPDIKPIDAFITPANKDFYSDPFSVYKKDLTKVNDLMTADGWTKGGDGVWAKGGKPAAIVMRTTAGNKRRELTEQILQSQWKEAGFNLTFDNQKSGTLFGQTLPKGDFQAAIYAQVPSSADPGICTTFCSSNIPTAANNNTGNNWTRTKDAKVDSTWDAVDKELDNGKRKDLVKQGHQALADIVSSLPLDPFPDVIVANTRLIGGPIDHNFVFGPWVNANDMFFKG